AQQHALADAVRVRIDLFRQRIGVAAVESKSVGVAVALRERDRVAAHLLDAGSGAARPKRGVNPVTKAVPTSTMAEPTIVYQPIASPRNRRPHRMPKTGLRNVTVRADVVPTSSISLKYRM